MLLQKKALQKKALQKKALDFCLENQSCDRRNDFCLENQSCDRRYAGRRTKFAPVKNLDSSDSDSEFSLFEFRFNVFFHESPPFSFFKPRKEKPPKRPGANT